MTDEPDGREIGVAEAKRRFAELLDRVRQGERFLVSRHGRPAAAIVPPSVEPVQAAPTRRSLAEFAGVLDDSDASELEAMVREIYESRERSADHEAPDLG